MYYLIAFTSGIVEWQSYSELQFFAKSTPAKQSCEFPAITPSVLTIGTIWTSQIVNKLTTLSLFATFMSERTSPSTKKEPIVKPGVYLAISTIIGFWNADSTTELYRSLKTRTGSSTPHRLLQRGSYLKLMNSGVISFRVSQRYSNLE